MCYLSWQLSVVFSFVLLAQCHTLHVCQLSHCVASVMYKHMHSIVLFAQLFNNSLAVSVSKKLLKWLTISRQLLLVIQNWWENPVHQLRAIFYAVTQQ